jgi:phosphatidylserine/phosphatidylglycerophosphate/cardiolipin synthase-like enzyme
MSAASPVTPARFWREMAGHDVEVLLFNPFFRRFWWFQPFRDHRKILAVDRKVAFTGGMNIGEEYGSPRARSGAAWRDTHVRVEGPAAWEMAVVFAEGWTRAGGRPFVIEPLAAGETGAEGARILVLDSRPYDDGGDLPPGSGGLEGDPAGRVGEPHSPAQVRRLAGARPDAAAVGAASSQ